MLEFEDLKGKQFSRLRVLYYEGLRKWVCQCSCGKMRVVSAGHLKSGNTKSCGCLQKDTNIARLTKHGGAAQGSRSEYQIWKGIRKRIYNSRAASYSRYGGRGISICERWEDSFENFLADMGARPSPQHSVDRRDNDGDYCPENCYWATASQQNRNTGRKLILTYKGESKPLAEWAESIGMRYRQLYRRIYTNKMTLEHAIETPIGGKPL